MSTMPGRVSSAIANLPPAYFAMVMATGIVSTACGLEGMPTLASILFVLDLGLFAGLSIVFGVRAFVHRARVVADLGDHARGVGYFTIIAATCIVGSQFVVVRADLATGRVLWFVAFGLWLVLAYGIFAAFATRETKPELGKSLNGGWLVSVVAMQGLSLLGGMIAPTFGPNQEVMLFVSTAFWMAGGMIYLSLITLIVYRYMFFSLSATDLGPPYWINMGAMAISTLAGASLVNRSAASPLLREMAPFLKGQTFLFWATATWWIPLLLLLGVWRHGIKRLPIRYDVGYWAAVFPLGMYTVCTHRLASALAAPFVLNVPRVTVFVSLGAWAFAFVGFLRSIAGVLFEKSDSAPPAPDNRDSREAIVG
jgi:tellurite resistance protein TehA-like permease